MALITDYRTDLADLLHDPNFQQWTSAQMDRYINKARTKIVKDTGCLRTLQTVYFSQGVEQYTFGAVTGASITNAGSGYPAGTYAINFAGGGGSGVAAAVGVSGGSVTSITFSSFGSGYTSAPVATISPVIGAGSLVSVTVATPGTAYNSQPTLAFSGGGGSNAAATQYLTPSGSNIAVINGGSGYALGDIIFLSGAGISEQVTSYFIVTSVSGGVVQAGGLSLFSPGVTIAPPTFPSATTAQTGAGTGLTVVVSYSLGAIRITNYGSGYTSAPAVAVNGGTPAVAGTVNATTAATTGTGASVAVGVINVNTYDILGVNVIWGTERYPLGWKPWTDFSARIRPWTTLQRRPAMWSAYGDNAIYIGPLPDQTYQAEIDSIILPTDISGSTVDPIPVICQAPIVFYAAYLATFNNQRFGEAAVYEEQYKQKMLEASQAYTRRIPSV